MKFKLRSATMSYDSEDLDELIEMEELEEIGFKYELEEDGYGRAEFYEVYNPSLEIEINTLEELMEFIKKYGRLIIEKDEIITYNDYIE